MNKSPQNKKESDKLINELRLNRVVEQVFYFDDEDVYSSIKNFVYETGLTHYGMRSLKPGGTFLYAVHRQYVVNNTHEFKQGVKICESMYYPDLKNLVLQGYISVDRDFNVCCEANDIRGKSNRESMAFPKYRWIFNDCEERAPRTLVNTGILDLIAKNELFGVVVEFTYYDIPVGINKEPLLIWEIRNY